MMTEKEVSPTLIKKIVGHSGAMSLTEKVYTHVNVQELLEAINKIEGIKIPAEGLSLSGYFLCNQFLKSLINFENSFSVSIYTSLK